MVSHFFWIRRGGNDIPHHSFQATQQAPKVGKCSTTVRLCGSLRSPIVVGGCSGMLAWGTPMDMTRRCISVYIYIKKNLLNLVIYIYIYIIHTGETIEKPVDLGVRYVQTNPYIIPSIYSRLFQYVWKWSRIRPAAPLGYKRFTIMSTSPVHSEAWRWRRWHLQTKAEAPGTRCHWSANRQATQDARFRHQGEGVTGTFLRLQQPQAKAGVERFCPGCLQSHGTPSGTAWHGHVAILNCLAPNWSCLIMEHVMIHLLGFSIDLASTKSIHIYIL